MGNIVEYKKGYSLSQVSRELTINRKTVYTWVRKGLIHSTRSDTGRSFVSHEELDRLKELFSGRR